jgi:hypothetical protein
VTSEPESEDLSVPEVEVEVEGSAPGLEPAAAAEGQAKPAESRSAKEAPKGPTKDSREKEIKALQKEVKGLDEAILAEKSAIALELVRQPPFACDREVVTTNLAAARSLDEQRRDLAARRDALKQTFQEIADRQAEKKQLDKDRKAQHQLISSRYVEVGRLAFAAFQGKPELHQGGVANLFAEIIALDQKIAEMQAQVAARQAEQGFMAKLKNTMAGLLESIPGEKDRDLKFAAIGGQVLIHEPAQRALGEPTIAQISAELQEPIGKIRQIDGRVAAIASELEGFEARLVELKGEAESPKAALAELDKTVSGFDRQLDPLLTAIVDGWLSPEPAAGGRTPALEESLARMKQSLVARAGARTQIERLRAENRIEELVAEREKILQKRHKLMQEIQGFDRRLADMHEEHVRLHGFVTKVAQGGAVDLADEEKKPPLQPHSPAPLEAGQVKTALARARLTTTQGDGRQLVIELLGGEGLLFGRAHQDAQRNLRNDWVCRSYPLDDNEAAGRTRRISKVHGGVRAEPNGRWSVADWSSAGMTVDNAVVEKNGWCALPSEPCVLNLAGGAVIVTLRSFAAGALVMERPADEGRWYAVVRQTMGLAVERGAVSAADASDGSPADFALLFRDGQFGVAPRAGRADISLNGQPLAGPQLLQSGAQIDCEGCRFVFEALPLEEPAV